MENWYTKENGRAEKYRTARTPAGRKERVARKSGACLRRVGA